MVLQSLLVQNLRIIEQLNISLAQDVNLFVGENGAGKTSILEAIDVLSRGRSFRDRRTSPLIQQHTHQLTVSGNILEEEERTHLGVQKSSTQTVLHCNQEKVASISTHAGYLPVITMHPDSHQLIQGGSKNRRNYIDWSAFHVKHDFLATWREYNKCLRQRNSALRNRYSTEALNVWTKPLCELGEKLNLARSEIFKEISILFDKYSCILLPECNLGIKFHPGWQIDNTLEESIYNTREQELNSKTTRCGPHRADIEIILNDQKASSLASRGQQKLLAATLLLAQIDHFQQTIGRKCVVLLDDIRAELDLHHAQAFLSALQNLGCQVFITAIERDQISLEGWQDTRVFHVKQGICKPLDAD